MSEPIVASYTQPQPHLLSLLSSYLPHSLPLLRRLQFACLPGGSTEYSRAIFIGSSKLEDVTAAAGSTTGIAVFTAAYVDVSRCPETEVWTYSSLESCATPATPEQAQLAWSQALALLKTAKELRDEYDAARGSKREESTVLFGTLSELVRKTLLVRGTVFAYCSLWDKWVFRLEALPETAVARVQRDMEGGRMGWGKINKEDTALVISRSKIPRKEKTLLLLPSMAIKLDDGTPIAWAFLGMLEPVFALLWLIYTRLLDSGTDGSLMSLHCEEAYRGRGFAKALATKLMQEHLKDFGSDGYCMADVAPDNAQSQAVCRSLGGEVMWTSSWSRIDLDRLPSTN